MNELFLVYSMDKTPRIYGDEKIARIQAQTFSRKLPGRTINIAVWFNANTAKTLWLESWKDGVIWEDGRCWNCGDNTYNPKKQLCKECEAEELFGMEYGKN